jgi:hypothetical protein
MLPVSVFHDTNKYPKHALFEIILNDAKILQIGVIFKAEHFDQGASNQVHPLGV